MTLPILRPLDNPPTDLFFGSLRHSVTRLCRFYVCCPTLQQTCFLAALGIQLHDFADFTSVGQPFNRPVLAALGQVPGQLFIQLSSQLLGQLSIQLSGQLSGIIGVRPGIRVWSEATDLQ